MIVALDWFYVPAPFKPELLNNFNSQWLSLRELATKRALERWIERERPS